MSVIEPASQPTRPSTHASETLQATLGVADVWAAVASAVQRFGTELGASPADIVVLLPLAHHLPLARAAWTALQPSSWMPRFETTRTLADSLAPMPRAEAGAPCFDADVDRLQAMEILAAAVPDWSRRDPRGFALAVSRVVDLTHSLARARAEQPPTARSSWAAVARERLAGSGAPAAAERVLARLALEWSLSAPTDAADALFAHRPAAWVGLRAGGCDALAEALLAAADSPTLWLDAERGLSAPSAGEVVVAACSDFENEAQRTAATVLALLQQDDGSRAPVALIALDRLLVRRVRALLERQHVTLADETGWKLSTTRAAARVASLLRAAGHRAGTDDLLDFLKSLPGAAPRGPHAHCIDALEAALRNHSWTDVTQVDRSRLPSLRVPQPLPCAWRRARRPGS
jgi:ATP-dependent helicase/nuclease subunit B